MDPVDVVYLDPMFDPSTRGRRHFQKSVHNFFGHWSQVAPGDTELFRIAISRARNRVVVKRASGDPPLVPTPDLQVLGKIAPLRHLPSGKYGVKVHWSEGDPFDTLCPKRYTPWTSQPSEPGRFSPSSSHSS